MILYYHLHRSSFFYLRILHIIKRYQYYFFTFQNEFGVPNIKGFLIVSFFQLASLLSYNFLSKNLIDVDDDQGGNIIDKTVTRILCCITKQKQSNKNKLNIYFTQVSSIYKQGKVHVQMDQYSNNRGMALRLILFS